MEPETCDRQIFVVVKIVKSLEGQNHDSSTKI
jgi:hypothetical protein